MSKITVEVEKEDDIITYRLELVLKNISENIKDPNDSDEKNPPIFVEHNDKFFTVTRVKGAKDKEGKLQGIILIASEEVEF